MTEAALPTGARTHTSEILQTLLDNIRPVEQAQCTARMCIQVKIYEGMKAKGWTWKQLAQEAKVSESTVYRWIKGDVDMKLSTLAELEVILNINLLNLTI